MSSSASVWMILAKLLEISHAFIKITEQESLSKVKEMVLKKKKKEMVLKQLSNNLYIK